MELTTLRLERVGDGTALLTIDRASKLNAMSHAFFEELPIVMAELDADPEIVSCVLTGAGRAFSVGGDLADFDSLDGVDAYRRQPRRALDAFHSLQRAQTIVVAAINGIAVAGGTELTLACDIAIASERAVFGFREASVGLMPSYGVIRGPEVIGRSWTSWLALTGRDIDAEQAARIGLVQMVCPHERLLEEAMGVAREIAAHPPAGVATAKQIINRGAASGLNESIAATAILFADPQHKRRVGEFLRQRARRKQQGG